LRCLVNVWPDQVTGDARNGFNAPRKRSTGQPLARQKQAHGGRRNTQPFRKGGLRGLFAFNILMEAIHARIMTYSHALSRLFVSCREKTMTPSQDSMKNRINEIRDERGLSYEDLAEMTGLSPSYVSLMSRGKRNISLKNLEKLAAALQCSPMDLIGDEPPIAADIAEIWAAIPADRRELARQVLESFIGKTPKK
jgi:transcriptional regulator with XRE-family HTH domain